MPGYEKRTRFYLLSCNHKTELAEPGPSKGDEQYCFKCNGYSTITLALVNYRARCISTCKWSRNFGDDSEKAHTWGRRHIDSHPKHKVEIRRDGEKIGEMTNMGEDLFSTHEEMRQLGANAQAVLREVFPDAEEIVSYEEGAFPF